MWVAMAAYYNENDPFAAEWLRQLIKAGLITEGEVDDRSIEDVEPSDLAGFTRCHFFAGIAGWDLALALAGWPDGDLVWTGSCPCQPFSVAGKKRGFDDERHLWPAWHSLIQKCQPPAIFGEQTESADGWAWLATVRADLEVSGYAVGAADLPAASVGAPQRRQRIWFVADSNGRHGRQRKQGEFGGQRSSQSGQAGRLCRTGGERSGRDAGAIPRSQAQGQGERVELGDQPDVAGAPGEGGRVEHADKIGSSVRQGIHLRPGGQSKTAVFKPRASSGGMGGGHCARKATERGISEGAGAERPRSPWRECDWIPCSDGKIRPVESGTFPLASRVPGDVGRLRGYGNSIVPLLASEFIRAYMEAA